MTKRSIFVQALSTCLPVCLSVCVCVSLPHFCPVSFSFFMAFFVLPHSFFSLPSFPFYITLLSFLTFFPMHPHSLSLSLRLPLLSLILSAHPFFPSPANSSLSSPSSPPPLLPSTQPTPLSMTHIISPQLFRARDCYGQQQPLHSSLMHVEVSLRLCLFRTLLFFCCCCCFAFVYPLSEFPSDSPLSGSAREKKKFGDT